MHAYIIAKVAILDRVKYNQYLKIIPPIIKKYKGEVIVKSENFETLEGSVEEGKYVVIKFHSENAAKQFYESTEYQKATQLRKNAAIGDLVLIKGN